MCASSMSAYQDFNNLELFRSGHTTTSIDSLPGEALLHIFSYLDTTSLGCCAKTCWYWRQLIAESQEVWKFQCLSLTESRNQVQQDRQQGHSWKDTFLKNYGRNGVKRLWRQGLYSNPTSVQDLPDKPLTSLDTDSWGEILQFELERS